jgi:hypothetical protein
MYFFKQLIQKKHSECNRQRLKQQEKSSRYVLERRKENIVTQINKQISSRMQACAFIVALHPGPHEGHCKHTH